MKRTVNTNITGPLKKHLAAFTPEFSVSEIGTVTSVGDGVAKVDGLEGCGYMEIVEFAGGIKGVAINLEEKSVGIIVMGEVLGIREGDEVRATGQILSTPVGDGFLGRVVNPLGEPVDGKPNVATKTRYPLEKIAPGVVFRQQVNTPLQTGIKAIDAMIPIGRGQRELIIGDRNTGKTAIAVDAIINQKGEDVICIYVAIGQKTSRVAQVINALEKFDAMSYSIVVSATSSDPASYQYMAPYTGCALAEYFLDRGKDVLVVYDDLSKHAWAYRQISLILRRPSGREAYPGDVFYLHSRLLERAVRLNDDHGGGSITALPIIETLANDLSAYIPTNVISITDGQIFLESDLFYAGQRPAINVGQSVSRVGSSAQIKAMKKIAGSLRVDLAQYRSLAAFAQFSTDVDEITKKQIDRGSRLVELLKQPQFVPMSVERQVVSIWAGTKGHLDDIPLSRIGDFEQQFLDFMEREHRKILTTIARDKALSEETEKQLKQAVEIFRKGFVV
ncbi:F0F1 ATP synthase subunit alpha [Candidatus Gottesmanbacteria bacterium RBG_16_52_11]|uniref:ATP synthase subunit alpha n=1 Tax=Candidatus Gottesmanbacteria bacterium RBG_16_52_11 TaxID=1798374 RepID=A0A1F5YQN8_9BACT|nr:MAG: F0F1 ATP synthase subunit alpha [Candidatus Gottesmanbacteria bacterium RBG_16_52_11]